jgi:branched-chain amino acid transport system ATP-binding protein
MKDMLKVDNIHTYYGESYVLQGVSLEVRPASVVALLGRNGMGKTTTLHSIMGFTPARRGEIVFKHRILKGLPSYKVARMGLALVPQGRRIFPSLTVEENLAMAERRLRGREAWSIEKIYNLFPALKERAKNKGNLISGGQQQMLAIGRALMTNPDMHLLDEPSEGLAPIIVQQLGAIIKELHLSGLSILLVEQNMRLALGVADYIYIINKGVIVFAGTPRELKNNREIETQYLCVATTCE